MLLLLKFDINVKDGDQILTKWMSRAIQKERMAENFENCNIKKIAR